ncbi:hypothetical protein [Frankia sp. R43]|uniref:hypothetical protein n=1 Tax=Frankia sp. R43 TaxID=269536 RepID=UPI000AC270C3|nr:hypothetical protein [Frankia sp. R43]
MSRFYGVKGTRTPVSAVVDPAALVAHLVKTIALSLSCTSWWQLGAVRHDI